MGGARELEGAWTTHVAGIRHRRNMLSETHFQGHPDLHVVSVFEPDWTARASTSRAAASRAPCALARPSQFADAVSAQALGRVVAEVCGACKLYSQILEDLRDEGALRAARARLDQALLLPAADPLPAAGRGAAQRAPGGARRGRVPGDIRAVRRALADSDDAVSDSSGSSSDESGSDSDDSAAEAPGAYRGFWQSTRSSTCAWRLAEARIGLCNTGQVIAWP